MPDELDETLHFTGRVPVPLRLEQRIRERIFYGPLRHVKTRVNDAVPIVNYSTRIGRTRREMFLERLRDRLRDAHYRRHNDVVEIRNPGTFSRSSAFQQIIAPDA